MTTNEIRQLQEALKIPQTGEYDQFTEAAVRNFQIKNNLNPTGILDNQTKELLFKEVSNGTISTDLSEKFGGIKHQLLQPNEYSRTDEKKEWLFLHHTAGWNNPFAVVTDWELDKRGQVGTQFIVGGRHLQTLDEKYDGQIVQCMPDYKCYGWHLGIGNTKVHRSSVGIELCNFGWLVKDGRDFRTYPILDSKGRLVRKGVVVNPKEIVDLKREFRGYRYFHKYSENQLMALKYLIEKIGKDIGIDITSGLKEKIKKDPLTAFDYDDNVRTGKLKGLFCHTHVSPPNKWGNFEKWDLFPQDEVIQLILSL